jgi:hypothetical protein
MRRINEGEENERSKSEKMALFLKNQNRQAS